MTRMWAVLGDSTSSGGKVVTGSAFTDVDGKPVARVTDKATCPKHQGTFPIVDGDPTTIIDGHPVALHGSRLACGCAVLAVQQVRVALQAGAGSGAPAAAATATTPMAWNGAGSVAESRADNVSDAGITHVHSDDPYRRPPDPEKAREVVQVSDEALLRAGAFRPYGTELEAAQAWAAIVEPIANSAEFEVEVGSNISRVGDHYLLGTAFSTGSYSSCDGLPEKGHKVAGGVHSAYVHTHPQPGGGVGRNRAYSYVEPGGPIGEGQPRPASGWDIGVGDFDSAYERGLNAYIAERGSLLEWNWRRYLELQHAAAGASSLGSGSAVELGAAETRH